MNRKIGMILWGVLLSLAGGLFLTGIFLRAEVAGTAFLFLCALVFIGIAMRFNKGWWAILPAGLFASLGLSALLETLIPHEEFPAPQNTFLIGEFTWVILLALAATFGYLWYLRKTRPTEWAKYPAAGLLALAILALILGSRFQDVWPISLGLVTGAVFLLAIFTRKELGFK